MSDSKDKNKSKKNKTESRGILKPGFTFGVIIGICFSLGLAIGRNLDLPEDIPLEQVIIYIVFFLLSLYIGIFFHIIAHESGHLIFGLLSGYKFLLFRIFNFTIMRENGKTKIKRYGIAGTGGQCLMVPPEPRGGKIPVMLYNLGGSLMNFFWCAVFAVLFIVFRSMFTYAGVIFIPAIFIGAFLGLVNIIPMKGILTGGVPNDGYNAFHLSKSAEEVEAFRMQLMVVAAISKGVRPKDFPPEWLKMPEKFNSPLSVGLASFVLSYYLDTLDFENVRKVAETTLDKAKKIPEIYKNEFNCELLFLEIIGEQRPEEIKRLYTDKLKTYIKASRSQVSKCRIDYAYEKLIAKNNAKAQKALKHFEDCCRKSPFTGEVEGERALLAAVDKAFDKEAVI